LAALVAAFADESAYSFIDFRFDRFQDSAGLQRQEARFR
jgi:hypothetical protein